MANCRTPLKPRTPPYYAADSYSTETPLAHIAQQARWARLADGADEVHQLRIAQRTIDAYKRDKSARAATGNPPL